MKGIGEKRTGRLLAVLLMVALLLTAVPASAQLIGDWENVSVNVFWFDDAGNTQMAQAWPVPEDQVQHGYWVTLPAEALGKTVQLQIMHPDYGYFFHFNDWSTETQWLLEDNAQDLSDDYAMYIGYSYNGVPQVSQIPDFIKLYLSTLQPPFETEGLMGPELLGPETFVPGVELIVPDAPQGGAELIVPEAPHGSGAELIVPEAKPAMASLLVEYVHEDGWRIDSQTKVLVPGEHWVYPESRLTADYELLGDDYAVVYVDNSGYTQTASVTFYYRDAEEPVVEVIRPQETERPVVEVIRPQETERPVVEVIRPTATEAPVTQITPAQKATITVRYLDDRGTPIAPDQTVELPNGSHILRPDPAVVPAGYTSFQGIDAAEVVVRNGRANQASVSFYFQKPVQTAAPERTFDVTIYYYDTENREIAPRGTMTVKPGIHRIEAPASILSNGYELMSDAVFELTVYEDGSYDRAAEDVAFWYRPAVKLPTTAKVSVRYLNESGKEIAAAHEVELATGQTHRVSPDVLRVPTGYDAASAEAVQVTVSAEGYASPAVVNFVFGLRREGANMPAGQRIDRYGITNAKVRFRTEPYATSNKTIIREVAKGSAVYMVANEYNDKGEMWTQVIINNQSGYMQTTYIDMLTAEASDLHARSVGATPVPTFTPAPTPTPTPTEVFVEYITPVPVTPTPAASYAVANWGTGIRTGTGSSDYIMDWLEQDELVTVSGQFYDSQTQNTWCYIRTLDGVAGYVQQSALRTVSQWEADWYRQQWQQQHAAPAATEVITNTPVPEQWQGYAYSLMDNVYLRQMASESSRILDQMSVGEVAYVASQQYVNGATWYQVSWDGQWGYVRSDFLRRMSDEQADMYFAQLFATPTPTPTQTPTSRPGTTMMSGYGYVKGDQVNLRADASTSSRALLSLNRYAMCMVLDTVNVGGQKWYHVSFARTEGYIRSDLFVEMSTAEFEDFLRSDRYQQGLRNNGLLQDADDLGVQGSGGLVSGEDEVLDNWYQSGAQQLPVHSPFVPPVGTPEPIPTATATPTRKPGAGYVGSYLPVETPVVTGGAGLGESSSDLPLPGETVGLITPPQSNANSGNGGSSPLAAIIVIALLLVAGVGVFAVVQHQRKRRRIAMRAAQRRAQQARSNGGSGMPNRVGAYFPQQNAPQAPGGQPTAQSQSGPLPIYNGFHMPQLQQNGQPVANTTPQPTAAVPQRPYARQNQPASGSSQQPAQSAQPRVGRRTAYQQALAAQQQNQNDQNP